MSESLAVMKFKLNKVRGMTVIQSSTDTKAAASKPAAGLGFLFMGRKQLVILNTHECPISVYVT